MAEENQHDARVEVLKRRLQEDLVDEEGRPPEPEAVARVVDAKVDALSDAPVQDFVPLLVEHQARDELRERGLHRELDDAHPQPSHSSRDDEPSDG